MTKQVHKMRFVATGGVLKGILKPDDEITNEEMISSSEETEDVGRVELLFNSTLNIGDMCMHRNLMNMRSDYETYS